MSERTKQILLIIGFVIVVLIIGFLLYLLFFSAIIPKPIEPTNLNLPLINGLPQINQNINGVPITNLNQPENVNIPLPSIPQPSITPGPIISNIAIGGLTSYNILESNTVYNVSLADNGTDLVYLDKSDGFIYRLIPESGQKQKITDQTFNNVENMVWSGNMDQAIFEYPDGGNIIYNFKTNKSVTLPSQWKDFDFSPDGNQIVFKNMMLDPEERYICTADTNGGDFTEIEALGDKDSDVAITWAPNNSYIALYREGLDASRSEIYPIGLNGENYSSLRVEGRDPRYIWSPSGSILLYSVFNSNSDFMPLLWYVSTNPASLGSNRNSLGINTWADKCVFATETIIYCAVPRTLEIGSGYLPSLADSTPDDFYRINLASGNKSMIAQPIFATTVDKLFISDDQSKLYWQEKGTGQIKEINLK
jgi:hypothetical protein